MQRLSSSRGGGDQSTATATAAPSPSSSCDIIAGLDEVIPANGQLMKPGKAATASVYRAKLAGHARVVTLSWSRHAFSVSVSGADGSSASCKVELRRSPWQYFWNPRRQSSSGARRLDLGDGSTPLRVLWDLRRARWHHHGHHGEPFGGSYYVALEEDSVAGGGGEVVFLVSGGSDPNKIAALAPVARREHVFGRRGRFAAKARFGEESTEHEIAIEIDGGGHGGGDEPEMEEMRIGIDGEEAAVVVKRLRWKFRGNQSVTFGKAKVEVYWDVHDWLFTEGAGVVRPALFIFRPIVLSSSGDGAAAANAAAGAGFCLYLYAWKLD